MTLKEEWEYKQIDENLRWEAAYPWVRDPKKLPNNKSIVYVKLQSRERRLMKNQKNTEQYNKQIDDMIKHGALRSIIEKKTNKIWWPGTLHLLPRRFKTCLKEYSVQNCLQYNVSFQGHVLNNYYAKGPTMLNNLLGVLVRFRPNHYHGWRFKDVPRYKDIASRPDDSFVPMKAHKSKQRTWHLRNDCI